MLCLGFGGLSKEACCLPLCRLGECATSYSQGVNSQILDLARPVDVQVCIGSSHCLGIPRFCGNPRFSIWGSIFEMSDMSSYCYARNSPHCSVPHVFCLRPSARNLLSFCIASRGPVSLHLMGLLVSQRGQRLRPRKFWG